MNKKLYLKFGWSLVLVIVTGFFALKTETASAQIETRKTLVKPTSLCQPNEQTIWNCTTTKNKIASVCGSKDLAGDQAYVQYRFGLLGKFELEYPKERKGSAQKFKYSRYTRPLVTMLTLSFENKGVVYEIHDDDNNEENPPVRAASINVGEVSITCKQPPKGSLMKLEDVVPRDEEN